MAKQRKNIWAELDALAEALDCGRDLAENRRKMIFIFAQLSRLEVRLMATAGPRSAI